MVAAVSAEVAVQTWDPVEDKVHDNTFQIRRFVLALLPKIKEANESVDIERIMRALSYVALKIEDIEYAEKITLAGQNGNVEGLRVLLREIKERPESLFLHMILADVFTNALEEGQDDVANLFWAEIGDDLEVDEFDGYRMLERAIERGDERRARWVLERFPIELEDIDDLFLEALENDMFFVLEAICEKYGNELCPFEMKHAFEGAVAQKGDLYLQGAQFLWPKVKDRVEDCALRSGLFTAETNQNQPMADFLKACMKEREVA